MGRYLSRAMGISSSYPGTTGTTRSGDPMSNNEGKYESITGPQRELAVNQTKISRRSIRAQEKIAYEAILLCSSYAS